MYIGYSRTCPGELLVKPWWPSVETPGRSTTGPSGTAARPAAAPAGDGGAPNPPAPGATTDDCRFSTITVGDS